MQLLLLLFLFIYFFLIFERYWSDPLSPNLHRTDLCQIFRVGRTVAVDDQSQFGF